MSKLFFILFIGSLSAQQTCKLSFSNGKLSQEGKMIFSVKNLNEKKIKIPNQYGNVWARPTDIQIYNEGKKEYEDTRYGFDGATCSNVKKCLGKTMCLKKGEGKEYEVQIIPGRISEAFKEKKKYRFKLAFDTYLFSGCNDYVTDWLYYDNTK